MEKSRINRAKLCAWFLILFTLVSCRQDARLEQALRLSGPNRTELEKVLAHFEGDSLKYAAACFIIENMPRAFGVDSLWKSTSEQQARHETGKRIPDLQSLSSVRLITEIEQSFKVWKENVYTRNASFEDFCEYILPYRCINGLLIDSARQVFYARHGSRFFVTEGKDMIDEADSLLYLYRKIVHSSFHETNIPIHDAAIFEHLGHGLCEHRCWYNSLIFFR